MHCHGAPSGPGLRGLDFFANQYPQSAGSPVLADPRAALAGRRVPALVIKGDV
jgi:hypothetical protein